MDQKKLLLWFNLFTIAFSGISLLERNFLLDEAIRGLLDVCGKSKINLIHRSEVWSNEIIDNLLMQNEAFSVQMENFESALIKTKRVKRFFVIIYVSEMFVLEQLCDKISDESFHFNGLFLIILKSHLELKNIFETFWRKLIFNVNVLVKDKSSPNALMLTFMPFNGVSCGDVSPIKINEFNAETLTWESKVFFPRKFDNLRGCSIKIGTFDDVPGTIIETDVNNITSYRGMEIDFMNGFAGSLNFKAELKIYPINPGKIFPNKTATGLMSRAYFQEVDLIFALFSLQQARVDYLSETRLFYFDKNILVIPKALLISPMEKLLLPFELLTWIGLLIVLLVACLVITLLKFTPRKFRNFVTGKSSRYDYLNLWLILLGGSQPNLPLRNFARFLLMSFAMFCLVIRNSYTGSLFHILKNDISSTDLYSIEQLIDLKFDFYIYESLAARLPEEKFTKR